eukprot:7064520-Karenia_brevis.AAC.1
MPLSSGKALQCRALKHKDLQSDLQVLWIYGLSDFSVINLHLLFGIHFLLFISSLRWCTTAATGTVPLS